MVVLNLEIGGLERVVSDLCLGLAAQGTQVSIVTLRSGGTLAAGLAQQGVQVHQLNLGDGLRPGNARQLACVLEDLRPEVVHSHGEAALFYTGLVKLFGGRFRHIHTRHGYEDVSWRGRLRNRLGHLSCQAVVCVSADLAAHCVKSEGLAAHKVRTVINGVNLQPFRCLERPDYVENEPVIGHVARLATIKNQALLLRSFARLLTCYPCARLEIVGDGPERHHLEIMSHELDMAQSVTFHGETQDVAARLANFHIFCLSSDSEGTPVSVIEAMAAGCPIVATDVGGLAGLVPETAGLLVAVNDPEALATALAAVYRSREAYAEFVAGARSAPASTQDIVAMLNAYRGVYADSATK